MALPPTLHRTVLDGFLQHLQPCWRTSRTEQATAVLKRKHRALTVAARMIVYMNIAIRPDMPTNDSQVAMHRARTLDRIAARRNDSPATPEASPGTAASLELPSRTTPTDRTAQLQNAKPSSPVAIEQPAPQLPYAAYANNGTTSHLDQRA